jgi:hypothetical protein
MSGKWGPLDERLADLEGGRRREIGAWSPYDERFDHQEFRRGLRRL